MPSTLAKDRSGCQPGFGRSALIGPYDPTSQAQGPEPPHAMAAMLDRWQTTPEASRC